MLPPLPRCSGWASSSLVSPNRVSLPRFHVRIGLHIVLFEVCSAFTRVAACTLARSPYVVTAIRRLQTLRLLHACSGRFRLERSPGGACTHWKSAALSRRTWILDLHRPSNPRHRDHYPRILPRKRDRTAMTAATQLAVFYATDSKILRRKVIPNDEAQLEGLSAGPGESMLLLPLSHPYDDAS